MARYCTETETRCGRTQQVTAIITMADEADGTRCVATVMHPDKATRDRHEEMGFFEGWGTCIDQLEAFAQQLS